MNPDRKAERKEQARTVGGWLKTLLIGEVDDVRELGGELVDDVRQDVRNRRASKGAAPVPERPPSPAMTPPPSPKRSEPRRPATCGEPVVLNGGCEAARAAETDTRLARRLSSQILNGLGREGRR